MVNCYDRVLSERETLERAISGASIARFGDGELRHALRGGTSPRQEASAALSSELKGILSGVNHDSPDAPLVCLPNVNHVAADRAKFWLPYQSQDVYESCRAGEYGSAFISRPDCAHSIDNDDYWRRFKDLWRGKRAVVISNDGSLPGIVNESAAAVHHVKCPDKNAYRSVDDLFAALAHADRLDGFVPDVHILSCGPTATVLANRLALSGFHAIDVGHWDMFYKQRGAFSFSLDDLASPEYRSVLESTHAVKDWGKGGAGHVHAVMRLCEAVGARGGLVLDYGCGQGKLKIPMKSAGYRVAEFDPGIEEKRKLPKPADVVVCTDVLEHIEPEKLDNVLKHIFALTKTAAYLLIACKEAKRVLTDGRNAHLIVRDYNWWLWKLANTGGWSKIKVHEANQKRLVVSCAREGVNLEQ